MSISYIIDTDVLIDILRDKSLSNSLDNFGNKGQIFCSVLTKTQIFAGIREKEKELTEKFLAKLLHIEVNYDIAKKAGEYLSKYSKSYDIDIADAVIAATAKEKGGIVITKNTKHYPMTDIEIVRWKTTE